MSNNKLLAYKRQLNEAEQGQLAEMIKGAGYLGLLEYMVSFAMADADNANEDIVLGLNEANALGLFAEELNTVFQDYKS